MIHPMLTKLHITVLLATVLLQGCETIAEDIVDPVRTREYSAEAIAGQVIDSATTKPLEGVVVVAHWDLRGGLEGGNVLGAVQVLETMTGKDGRYHFPAWGPTSHTARGTLDHTAPALLFFHRGYMAAARSNAYPQLPAIKPPYGRFSRWNGETIPLTTLSNSDQATRRNWSMMRSNLSFVVMADPKQCEWKRVPRLIAEMIAHDRTFGVSGYSHADALGFDLQKNDDYFKKIGCGSPVDFLKNLKLQ
jgi:hypothetical protein